jgi:hypothetical protein
MCIIQTIYTKVIKILTNTHKYTMNPVFQWEEKHNKVFDLKHPLLGEAAYSMNPIVTVLGDMSLVYTPATNRN